MIQSKTKIEYGDFQTPLILTNKICNKLVELKVFADTIIEPTCGVGNFLQSSSYFFKESKEIIGIEINKSYIDQLNKKNGQKNNKIRIINDNFFNIDLGQIISYKNSNLWKIAICGLYKKLDFKLFYLIENKPVMFDDTVYFISFQEKNEATKVLDILNSSTIISFYSSFIFWDEKRPIKASILNCLDWEKIKTISEST